MSAITPLSFDNYTNTKISYNNISQNINTSANNRISNYLTPTNIILGTVFISAALLCAYGIISNLKKGKIPEKNNLLPVEQQNIKTVINTKEEFKKILSGLTHDDFDSSKTFKANFHIHSKMSDGKLEPLEILNQANDYAQKLPASEKFSFSVTDHDNINGVKEIFNEIKKNPEKYKKLNFVPGIELSVKYHNPEFAQNPIELDFLIYGFDVNNPKLQNEISRRQNYLLTHTNNLFNDINKEYPTLNLSVDKMRKEANNGHLKHLCSNGYLKGLNNYIKEAFEKENINYNEDSLLIKNFNHFNNDQFALDANIDLLKAVDLTKEIGGFCSIAHPGKFNFNHAGLKTDGLVYSDDIISRFINAGGDGIESHYMSYKPNNQDWWSRIRNSFKRLNLSYSRIGGYDTHGSNIGKH